MRSRNAVPVDIVEEEKSKGLKRYGRDIEKEVLQIKEEVKEIKQLLLMVLRKVN